jgi:hypothetical protein
LLLACVAGITPRASDLSRVLGCKVDRAQNATRSGAEGMLPSTDRSRDGTSTTFEKHRRP